MKILLRSLFTIIFLLYFSDNCVYAVSSLTVNDAVYTALKNRLEIAIDDQDIIKAKSRLDEARSELYPRLDLLGTSRYTKTINKFEPVQISFELLGKTNTISPTKDVPEYQSSLSVQATQRLFTGGNVTGKIEGAKERISQNEMLKELHKREIILAVIKAYWELKRADKIYGIEKEKAKHSEIILATAKARYEKGTIAGLEMEKSEVDFVNSKGDLLQAASARNIAEVGLLKEMGIIETGNETTFITQDQPLNILHQSYLKTPDGAVEDALLSRPEIKHIKKRISANEADIMIAKSTYYPQVDLVGNYNWTGWHNNSLAGSWREMTKDYWSIMLKFDFNIFEGYATKSRVNQALAEARASRITMDKERQIILAGIKRSHYTMTDSVERITTLFRNLSLSEKNLEAAKKQFELGVMTLVQVAEYNLSLADTRKRYICAIIDFEIAKTEYRWALGEDLV